MEEIHTALSHINCTVASVACCGEFAGRKSESTCCATQVPKMHMANSGIFFWLFRKMKSSSLFVGLIF